MLDVWPWLLFGPGRPSSCSPGRCSGPSHLCPRKLLPWPPKERKNAYGRREHGSTLRPRRKDKAEPANSPLPKRVDLYHAIRARSPSNLRNPWPDGMGIFRAEQGLPLSQQVLLTRRFTIRALARACWRRQKKRKRGKSERNGNWIGSWKWKRK